MTGKYKYFNALKNIYREKSCSQLQLPAPDNAAVEHEVSAEGELVALVTWSNDGVSINGETLPDNEDVFTIIEIWDQGDIVHTQNATLDDGR